MAHAATLTGAIEREFGWARLALKEIITTLALPELDVTEDARTRARARFARFPLPAAVFLPEGIQMATEAWRSIVGETVPIWAAVSLEVARRAGVTTHLDGIPTLNRACSLAVMVSRAQVSDFRTVMAIGTLMTETAIAGELRAPSDALVWSGAVTSGNVPDYCNERAQLFSGGNGLEAFSRSHDTHWKRALADAIRQRSTIELELELARADGQLVMHRAAIMVTNNATRWFAIARSEGALTRDEHDRLLLQIETTQRDAEIARRVQDQVLAAVSHELRTPVTAMTLWLRVLRDPLANAATRAQAIDAIQQSAAAQAHVVGDLLDISRAMSGKLHIDLRVLDLRALVQDVVSASAPAALAKRIELVHSADPLIGNVHGDAARLRQVLDNLLGNAIKFTPPDGKVTIRVRRESSVVVIEVEDTGCGIEPDALDLIFEPFRQLESQRAPNTGLGLGLAIALQIVELHNGTIEAMSEGHGRGTRMTVTLPVLELPQAASPPAHVVVASSLSDVRVLVVDDDERVREALTLLLSRAGARVIPAESASVARERLISDSPQVVVCDIAMPGEDGHAFIRSLRAAGNNVPAIAVTGFASKADAATAMASGFDMHLAKPIDFELLVARMTQLLSTTSSAG